jgi:glyoxylase-like metal-dependent hydrolase (beta-lactamase superfamily II)
MKLGNFQIDWLEGGRFELDGGTMFGVVPKVLWTRKYPADENNYIKMTNSPMLVRTGDANIIIETGLGNKLTDKQNKIFRVGTAWDLPGSLEALGLKREDIDYVILTHLDFDHAGGISMLNSAGEQELTFPRAKHIVQKIEWEDAMAPNTRASSTYWEHNYAQIKNSDKLTIVDGDYNVLPGVDLIFTAGHTRGHQAVRIESESEVALHMADLLPTHAHFNPLWVMAYDNFPLEAIEQKERLYKMASDSNAWYTFYHDEYMRACKYDDKGAVIAQVQE